MRIIRWKIVSTNAFCDSCNTHLPVDQLVTKIKSCKCGHKTIIICDSCLDVITNLKNSGDHQ
jgi:predicted RNA-binding Zn-ribbon protein involved in translation (DUF1610 family)